MTFKPQPKKLPHAIEKRERAADVARIDREESAKVKARSRGLCEVFQFGMVGSLTGLLRCFRHTAPGNHHLIAGIGRRNRGKSILAEHRLAVCQPCHDDITRKVLRPIGDQDQRECAATVVYERVTRTT